jgi:geranylgeranylglycerol-phosphate geranylgeranyltransferase
MIGFAVIVGEFISSTVVPASAALYGFTAGFLLLAASMVLNDYFDREIDAINEPNRPLPSGRVKDHEALSFALILGALGLLAASYTGVATLLVAIFSLVVMVSYNAKIKKTGLLGNVFVSMNVAIPFIYGGFAIARPNWTVMIFALLAFLSSVGREIIKGISDVPGDSSRGVRSVAATRGIQVAAKCGGAFFVSAVCLSVFPLLLGLVTNFYIPLVIISDVGFLLTTYSILTNPTPRSAKRNKRYVLVWMTFGLLAFLMGTF